MLSARYTVCGQIRVLFVNKFDVKMFVDQFLCFLDNLKFDVVYDIMRIILISFKQSSVCVRVPELGAKTLEQSIFAGARVGA